MKVKTGPWPGPANPLERAFWQKAGSPSYEEWRQIKYHPSLGRLRQQEDRAHRAGRRNTNA